MIRVPDPSWKTNPDIVAAESAGEPGPLCDDCGDEIRDYAWAFDGLTLCRDCLRERLIDYMDTNFREAAEALGCTATYLG